METYQESVAWVGTADTNMQAVVFSSCETDATRAVATFLECEIDEISSLARTPELDQYVKTGVPLLTMVLEYDWVGACRCGKEFTEYDINALGLKPVEPQNGSLYCSQDCCDKFAPVVA